MKVVFDTNIFISAFAIPGGRAEEAITRVIEGNVQLLLSKPIVHEILNVLARKFDRDREELARVAVYFADLGKMIHTKRKVKVFTDDPDNRIIGCALSGKAGFIVTGDKAMLRLGKFKEVEVITLKEFLKLC
ncbi:MAG: putative toxin-antitoxin system toxin component, PIN family [Nitrospinota bacterium]